MPSSLLEWQEWLYTRLQAYERSGRKALHPTLAFMEQWDAVLNHPHRAYPVLHIAGTNGKGSTAALLSAILQAAGYRVGLHTSPHLWRFTERMRVNGQEPPEEWATGFLSHWADTIERLDLSFFEATVGMSLAWFAEAGVDVAVVEVGLGGRWDATNVLLPEVAVITPIGWDHVEILGPTLAHIAREKAGIIKPKRPVVVSPAQPPEALEVFWEVSKQLQAPLHLTDSCGFQPADWVQAENTFLRRFVSSAQGEAWLCSLTGDYQATNLATVWGVVEVLRKQGWRISAEALHEGVAQVVQSAPLYGRGQWLSVSGKWVLFDVAHNPPGLAALRSLVEAAPVPLEGLVIGFSREKDIAGSLKELGGWQGPVFFTAADNPRALPPEQLEQVASELGYRGTSYPSVQAAVGAALASCQSVLVTGSVFVVAEALRALNAFP